MRKVRIVLALAVLAVVAGTLGIGQTHQTDPLNCAGEIHAIPQASGAVMYIDDHAEDGLPIGPPGLNEYWIYLESNNHPGLQKGGYNPILVQALGEELTETAGELDSCNTQHNGSGPDTIVF